MIIKIKNGSIHLEHYMHNENQNMSIGLKALSFTNSDNTVKIENDCLITADDITITVKKGFYTIEKLNKTIRSLNFSLVDKKIKIESANYYALDENLKRYLGFKDIDFDFTITSINRMIYYPTSDEHYINIEQECEFKIDEKAYKIPVGIYSIDEIQTLLNLDKKICNTKLTVVNKYLKISTNYEYSFDSYFLNSLGIPFFHYTTNYNTEPSFNRSVTGTEMPKYYTKNFLKDINGIIRARGIETVIEKKNYTIDQLNKLLPSDIKIVQTNNCISIKSNIYYSLDENLRSSLGLGEKYIHKHIGSDITLCSFSENKCFEVHCNITEKSISNHKTEQYLHADCNILDVIKCDSGGNYIVNSVEYIPLNVIDFKHIKLSIVDLDGNEEIHSEFVAYLILKTL